MQCLSTSFWGYLYPVGPPKTPAVEDRKGGCHNKGQKDGFENLPQQQTASHFRTINYKLGTSHSSGASHRIEVVTQHTGSQLQLMHTRLEVGVTLNHVFYARPSHLKLHGPKEASKILMCLLSMCCNTEGNTRSIS